MLETETQLKSILERAEQVEKAARRRALLLTLLPVFFAVLLLGFTFWQVQQASENLNQMTANYKTVKADYEQVNQTLGVTRVTQQAASAELDQSQAELDSVNQSLNYTRLQLINLQKQAEISTSLLLQTHTDLISKTQALSETMKKMDETNRQVQELEKLVGALQEQTEIAQSLQEHRFPESWAATFKELDTRFFSNDPLRALLEAIDTAYMSRYRWNVKGASPQTGFNSPSLAAYLLDRQGLLPPSRVTITNQPALQKILPARRGAPQPGDVIFYKSGYTLFYFEDEAGSPFVIGMTPRGILPMDYDFSTRTGIGAVFSP